jgi:hypothetical protein
MNPAPPLPRPRGPLSERLLGRLAERPRSSGEPLLGRRVVAAADPWGDDVHVALYTVLELGFRGLSGVDPGWEVQPAAVRAVNLLEDLFLEAVAAETGPAPARATSRDVRRELEALANGDGPSLSAWVDEHGTLDHLREFAVHRSAYQLKEADPHTFALPRLAAGRAKAAFVEIQADEYGSGRPGRSHQELFAATLRHLGLDDGYGAYVDLVPAPTLATVNLLSLFGRSRRWLGACVGHLALFEMTSVGPMARYARALRRLTGGVAGAEFYDVHVVADQHHQRLALDGMVMPFAAEEPHLAGDVVFGARALTVVEGRLTDHLLDRWRAGRTSLRRPLGELGRTTAA